MKRRQYTFFLLFILSFFTQWIFNSPLRADPAENEYTVSLGAGSIAHPTAIVSADVDEAKPLSKEYKEALLSAFAFDIDMNGMMALVDKKTEQRVQQLARTLPLPIEELKKIPLSYLLECRIDGASFCVKATSLADSVAQQFSPLPLSHTLATDRARVHQLADFILQSLFQQKGICTTQLLYSKKCTKEIAEIYLSDYDGKNERQVTNQKTLAVTPQWIPGRYPCFLFVSYLIGQPKMYLGSIKEPLTRRVTPMRGNQLTPAVSSDGKQLAFCSDITGSSDLYFLTFDPKIGAISKPRQLYKTAACATGCPAFSPDGSQVAFVSNKDGSPKIYVIPLPLEGSKLCDIKPKQISKKCRENSAPCWSPDGKKIAYTSRARPGSERQIWIYDVDLGIEYQLTSGPYHKENPSWAPNSFHLAYQALDSQGKWNIYIMNLQQKKPVKITNGSANHQFPSWSPR